MTAFKLPTTRYQLCTHMHTVHPFPPVVNRTNTFEDDSISVVLKWAAEDAVTYNVTISPQVFAKKIYATSVELRVSYNTTYIVSILATLCGQSSTSTTIEIYFGKFF